jgi:hypothetical protein
MAHDRSRSRLVVAVVGVLVVWVAVGAAADGGVAADSRPVDDRAVHTNGTTPTRTPTSTPISTGHDCWPDMARTPPCTPTPTPTPTPDDSWIGLLQPSLAFLAVGSVGLLALGGVLARWRLAPDEG